MKFLFKLFSVFTVVFFFAFFTVYMLISTSPPPVEVSRDVKKYIYPVARENVKINFDRLQAEFMGGQSIKSEFVVSELEINAYLDQYFPPPAKAPVKTPYIFLQDDRVRVRLNVSMDEVKRFALNRLKGREMNADVVETARRAKTGFQVGVTADIGLIWHRDEYPYLFVDGVYVGMLPLPVKMILGRAEGGVNNRLRLICDKVMEKSPYLIRGIKVHDGYAVMKIEAKLTDNKIRQRELRQYAQGSAPLATEMRRPGLCRFGCTAEEREAIGKFMDKARVLGYDQYDDPELVKQAAKMLGAGGTPRGK